ncbi:hypothetical protein ACI77O_13165 [Pseudomonas tritici]|uniref:hypothetical protein n=1 Tax=Pseudomonas tritici TaxID=2745518 RepID=UPI00387B2E93
MTTETAQLNIVEKAFLSVCAAVWRCLRMLDPQKVQRYFAAKVNITGFLISNLHTLSTEDAKEHICRINNNRMKEGKGFLAKRGDLLKVYNPDNGTFVFRYAQGAGELKIRYQDLGLDYDAKKALGVLDLEEVNLQVMKANPADKEFYLMYQDRSVSSRHSRALGWYMLLGSLLFTVATSAYGWVNTLISTFF